MKKIFKIWLLCLVSPFLAADPNKLSANIKLCSACHGSNGISSTANWPHLAGQNTRYLLKQLVDYQQNTQRHSSIMQAAVKNLSLAELKPLASYYAQQPRPFGLADPQYVVRGEQLYRSGDRALKITACIACHGPKGQGNPQAGFPLLAGQQALYLVETLQAFKEKKRTNDLNGIMQSIASHLSTKDMQAVASYIQGLY